MIRKIFLTACILLLSTLLFAQGRPDVEMADVMRDNGKIYVVVAVILTIFAGIILYLVRLDRKMTRMEKESKIHFTHK